MACVNDAPVASAGALTTTEDTRESGMLSASDIEGDLLTYSIVAAPAKGTISTLITSTGIFSYTPSADANGSDSFSFKANDGSADSNVATVLVTITPVNDPPVASAGVLTTNEDTGVRGTLSASDTEGDPLTYSIVSAPTKGTISTLITSTGVFTYTPSPDANGSDSFSFKVRDGSADSNVATVLVTIAPVNDPPHFTVGPAGNRQRRCRCATPSDGTGHSPAQRMRVGNRSHSK